MSKRTESLARTLEDLSKAAPGLHDAVARVQDQRRGLPGATSYDRAGGRSSTTPDPTGQAVASTASKEIPLGRPDPARAQLAELDERLRRQEADALWILRFVQSNTPHTPTAKDKVALAAAVEEPTDCEHCTKAGIYEPAAHTGTVSGNLPHPMRLCSGCYRDVYRSCRLPKAETCLFRHERGKNPMVKV